MEDLDSPAGDFRLCQLRTQDDDPESLDLSVRRYNLNDAPMYHTLSYVWGDQKSRCTIKINGNIRTVTRNLFDALLRLRSENAIINLWIDAICIDQENVDERAAQVKLMHRIYSQSTQTLLFLGNDEMSDPRALDLIRSWAELGQGTVTVEELHQFLQKYPDAFNENSWNALEHFIERSYWRRIWTYQEVVLSQSCEIYYDRFDKVSLALLTRAVLAWTKWLQPETSSILDSEQISIINGIEFDNVLSLAAHRYFRSHPGSRDTMQSTMHMDILTLLRLRHFYESTDPRDKIFALFGVTEQFSMSLQVDYAATVGQVYTRFTSEHVKQTKSLDIIESSGVGISCREQRLDTPSWVPDFRASARWPVALSKFNTSFVEVGFGGVSPSFTTSITGSILSTSGIQRDVVTKVVAKRDKFEDVWYEAISDSVVAHPTGMEVPQVFFRTLITDNSPDLLRASTPSPQQLPVLAIGFLASLQVYLWRKLQNDPVYDAFVEHVLDHDQPVETVLAYFRYWTTGHISAESTDEELLQKFTGALSSPGYIDITRMNQLSEKYLDVFREMFHTQSTITSQNRSLIMCDGGYIGLGPEGTWEGDLVCTLDGCSIPFILRRVGDNYIMVGSCYMYGLMHKGRTQRLDEQGLQSSTFKII